MKVLVSLLLFGLLSLPFSHDHEVFQAEEGYGVRTSQHGTLIRHVHLDEHSSHFPKPESGEHKSQNQWPFPDHISLITLASGSGAHLSTILYKVDSSHSNYKSPVGYQGLWKPTSPVRGSPLINSDNVLLSSNPPPLHSGRAPPLSAV